MAHDSLGGFNIYATFRFAVAYPGERHLDFFRRISKDVPENVAELRSLHISLFEAGVPHPKCPLIESHYVLNRPAPQVVLENKLYYQHFGLRVLSQAAPDHLLTQLEFLSWLEHCLESGNPDWESIQKAKQDFLDRHACHWLPSAARLVRFAEGRCYIDLFNMMVDALKEESRLSAGGSAEFAGTN